LTYGQNVGDQEREVNRNAINYERARRANEEKRFREQEIYRRAKEGYGFEGESLQNKLNQDQAMANVGLGTAGQMANLAAGHGGQMAEISIQQGNAAAAARMAEGSPLGNVMDLAGGAADIYTGFGGGSTQGSFSGLGNTNTSRTIGY